MKDNDLIKRLKKIDLPKIHLQSHQRQLRMALLSSVNFQGRTKMRLFPRLGFIGLGLGLVIALLGITIIQPQIMTARAKEIVKKDSRVQELIKDYNAEVKEVKLIGNKAFVLLSPSKKLPLEKRPLLKSIEEKAEVFVGSLAEVDLKARKLTSLKAIKEKSQSVVLSREDHQKALQLAQSKLAQEEKPVSLEEAELILTPRPSVELYLDKDKDQKKVKVLSKPVKEQRPLVSFNSPEGLVTVDLAENEAIALSNQIEVDQEVDSSLPVEIIDSSEDEQGLENKENELLEKLIKIAVRDIRVQKLIGNPKYYSLKTEHIIDGVYKLVVEMLSIQSSPATEAMILRPDGPKSTFPNYELDINLRTERVISMKDLTDNIYVKDLASYQELKETISQLKKHQIILDLLRNLRLYSFTMGEVTKSTKSVFINGLARDSGLRCYKAIIDFRGRLVSLRDLINNIPVFRPVLSDEGPLPLGEETEKVEAEPTRQKVVSESEEAVQSIKASQPEIRLYEIKPISQ